MSWTPTLSNLTLIGLVIGRDTERSPLFTASPQQTVKIKGSSFNRIFSNIYNGHAARFSIANCVFRDVQSTLLVASSDDFYRCSNTYIEVEDSTIYGGGSDPITGVFDFTNVSFVIRRLKIYNVTYSPSGDDRRSIIGTFRDCLDGNNTMEDIIIIHHTKTGEDQEFHNPPETESPTNPEASTSPETGSPSSPQASTSPETGSPSSPQASTSPETGSPSSPQASTSSETGSPTNPDNDGGASSPDNSSEDAQIVVQQESLDDESNVHDITPRPFFNFYSSNIQCSYIYIFNGFVFEGSGSYKYFFNLESQSNITFDNISLFDDRGEMNGIRVSDGSEANITNAIVNSTNGYYAFYVSYSTAMLENVCLYNSRNLAVYERTAKVVYNFVIEDQCQIDSWEWVKHFPTAKPTTNEDDTTTSKLTISIFVIIFAGIFICAVIFIFKKSKEEEHNEEEEDEEDDYEEDDLDDF